MSLVEKALEKMQNAQRQTAPGSPRQAAHGTYGAVVSGGARSTAAPAASPGLFIFNHDRLIQINQTALRLAGLLPPTHQERQLAQQYRQIKRPLIDKAFGPARIPKGSLIMLASALSGEGKTFTSINLAFSIAREPEVQVLLVDADVAKPHISELFGVTDQPGLLDVLRDKSISLESAVLPTDVPNLHILPAGRRSESATELLASGRMQEVTAVLERAPNCIVIFDSPPLLLTTESQVLANAVGQIALVVRAGKTSQRTVLDALSHLGNGRTVSLILNQAVGVSGDRYYYGYNNETRSPSERES